MSRRKRTAKHVNHERWLVSYADFITLLFAFFVVLYSSSQVDKRKMGKLAESIQAAFQKLGVFDTSNTQIPLSDSEAVPFSQIEAADNNGRTTAPMRDIAADLQKALAPEISKHIVELKGSKQGLIISLREVGFYLSGSATLRPSSKDAIDRLAAVLQSRTELLRIEGHTDDVPIHNGRFESNWELSTARASNLVKLFVEHYGLRGQRLSAAGYAEFHPVAANDSPEGRAKNRRIDIVVLNPSALDASSQPAPNPLGETSPTKAFDEPSYVPQ